MFNTFFIRNNSKVLNNCHREIILDYYIYIYILLVIYDEKEYFFSLAKKSIDNKLIITSNGNRTKKNIFQMC